MGWIVSIPVWGDWYIRLFLGATLPALRAAAQALGEPVRYVIHSDQADWIAAAMPGDDAEFHPLPAAKSPHEQFAAANREAFESAPHGTKVVLLNADIVVSREAFTAAAERFAQGKKVIVCCGSRTYSAAPPPVGARSAALLDWTMAHRHPIIEDCFWGKGRTTVPWAIYFSSGEHVTLRGFHLHPLVVLKDRSADWRGSPDLDLLNNFDPAQIHVVTDRHELAMAEMSHPERRFPLQPQPISVSSIAKWATRKSTERHRWLSNHRIIIQGSGGTEDEKVWPQILASLGPAMYSASTR